jgi:V8-like Glu-specific endopeptidase
MFRCLLAIALVQSSICSATVFDADDRVPVRSQSLHSGTIGTGVYADRQTTVFLVDACYAVTAQHLISADADPLGQRVQLFFGNERVTADAVRAGHMERRQDPADFSNDWLLLKLDQCLNDAPIAQLAADPFHDPAAILGSGRKLTAVGFPSDVRQLMVDPDCRIRAVAAKGWLNDCAAHPGSSGSPLFIERNGQPVVFAIQAAGFVSNVPEAFTAERANVATSVTAVRQALLTEKANAAQPRLAMRAKRRWF